MLMNSIFFPSFLPSRLPFIPATIRLPDCNSSAAAKVTRAAYLDAMFEPLPPGGEDDTTASAAAECAACQKRERCETVVYESRVKSVPTDRRTNPTAFNVVFFNFDSSPVEIFRAIGADDPVRLMSDFGSLLGFLTGASVFSGFRKMRARAAARYYSARRREREKKLSLRRTRCKKTQKKV